MKNSIASFIILFALSLIFTSCGNNQDSSAEEADTAASENIIAEENTTNEEPSEKAQVDYAKVSPLILKGYIQIKNALVESDPNEASKDAKELLENLPETSKDELVKFEKRLREIASSEDLEDQRRHFNELSEDVYELVKKNSARLNTVYRQYCPMAFDNEGAYWLSSEEEIRNPYFGDKMLKCGKVEEEI